MTDKKINNNGFDFIYLGLPSGTLWATAKYEVYNGDPVVVGENGESTLVDPVYETGLFFTE